MRQFIFLTCFIALSFSSPVFANEDYTPTKVVDLAVYRASRTCKAFLRLPQHETTERLIAELKNAPPLFLVLHHTIHFVRGIDSQFNRVHYSTVQISYESVKRQGSLKYRLMDFVGSWEAIGTFEEDIQYMLRTLIHQHIPDHVTEFESEDFTRMMFPAFLSKFKPEVVDSLVSYVSK